MIGLMNEKAALPVPVPETKAPVDSLFHRKGNQNQESGRTDFENYLKAATTDKTKPFRETGSKASDHRTTERQDHRIENKAPDSPKQVVKEDKRPQNDELQSKVDDNKEVSAKAPEQPVTDSTASGSGDTQTDANAGVQALNLNLVNQTPVNDGTQLIEALTGVQSIDTTEGNDLAQLQLNLLTGELLNGQKPETTGETDAGNQQNTTAGQTATAQNAVDALMGVTQDSNSANGQTVTTANQAMTEAMEALLSAKTSQKDTGSQATGSQPQAKVNETGENGPKAAVLNSAVLEVFQDKVAAQAATQNLSHSKDELQQSLQNAVTGKTLVTGTENKPLNLAVLQTQLAVGENPDKTNTTIVMPLQQHQTAAGQFQEVTGMTAQSAGKDQLFGQIMEHAKLMLSANQSEMEMSLKPEHLGKLQLKVMVENQVVTARFVAESQQVKQIIETNLSQLRDQLRESGLMVDHLSVSVGNGGNEQLFNQTAGNQSQFSGSSHGSHSYTDDMSDMQVTGDAVSTPKSLQDTVIDLMA